jgi:hypothetical protein
VIVVVDDAVSTVAAIASTKQIDKSKNHNILFNRYVSNLLHGRVGSVPHKLAEISRAVNRERGKGLMDAHGNSSSWIEHYST